MPPDAWKSKANKTASILKKKPKTNVGEYEHPSGMTNFEAVALIHTQEGITDAQKVFWVHCVNGGWSKGYVFLSKKHTPVALRLTWKTISDAKTFLRLHKLIDVDKSTKAHAIKCNDRLKWLAQLPEGIIWKDVRTGTGNIEEEIRDHLEKRGMLDGGNFYPLPTSEQVKDDPSMGVNFSSDGCKFYTQKEIQKENIKKERTATSLTYKQKIISGQLNEILQNLREWESSFDGVNVWAEFDLFKQSLPKPWQIPDSAEINLEADWIRHLKQKTGSLN